MEIAEADKQVRLLTWAAETAASKGMPGAATLQQKAADAAQALEFLKQKGNAEGGGSAPVASAPVASAPVASAPVASGSAGDKEEIKAAKRTADLLTWAAKACTDKGLPQAGMMQAKARDAVAALEALKKGSPAPAPTAPPSIAKEDCPVPTSMAGVTKEQIREAERHAYLLSWAAETAGKQGMPQASALQAKALAAVKALEDLKACADDGRPAPAPVAASPGASVPVAQVAPAAVSGSVSKAEFLAAKKQADLLVWAAKSAAAKGMPQATQLQANADAALAKASAMSKAMA